ncbi:hypothetical protein ACXO0C_07300 [Lactobacillus delbrueckii subsp. bulgaricus]|nr:hypothetical protein [Lactobacillus delbrueckii]
MPDPAALSGIIMIGYQQYSPDRFMLETSPLSLAMKPLKMHLSPDHSRKP